MHPGPCLERCERAADRAAAADGAIEPIPADMAINMALACQSWLGGAGRTSDRRRRRRDRHCAAAAVGFVDGRAADRRRRRGPRTEHG